MKTAEEIFKLWKLGEPPFIESAVLRAMEQYASQFQSGEQLYREALEQDLKELDASFDYLCKMDGVKDAGHRWIEFTDKWNAFKKRLALPSPQLAGHKEEGGTDTSPICRTELFKELKGMIGGLQFDFLGLSEDGKYIEANPATHAIAKYAYHMIQKSAVSPSPGEQEAELIALYKGLTLSNWVPSEQRQQYAKRLQSLLSKEQNPETEKQKL